MRKNIKKITALAITSVVISIVAVSAYYVSIEIQKSHDPGFEWVTSGPFSVQKSKYRLGENVIWVAYAIPSTEKGTIRFYTPKNIEYVSYPFDGSMKSQFNISFKPDTTFRKDLCSPEDFVGVWTMEIDGTSYPPIKFEFTNEYLPGAEVDVIYLCRDAT